MAYRALALLPLPMRPLSALVRAVPGDLSAPERVATFRAPVVMLDRLAFNHDPGAFRLLGGHGAHIVTRPIGSLTTVTYYHL